MRGGGWCRGRVYGAALPLVLRGWRRGLLIVHSAKVVVLVNEGREHVVVDVVVGTLVLNSAPLLRRFCNAGLQCGILALELDIFALRVKGGGAPKTQLALQ